MPVNPFLAAATAAKDPSPDTSVEPTPAPAPDAPAPAADKDPDPAPSTPATPAPPAPAPATAKDPSPDAPGPSRSGALRRRLSFNEVERLRHAYAYARDLADSATDTWETVTDTEERLAAEYGVSRSTVHGAVLGLTYPNAGGPLDIERRANFDQYVADREVLGPHAARSRAVKRRAGGTTAPASMVRVTATTPAGETWTRLFPIGTRVEVVVETSSVAGDDGGDDQPDSTS